LRMFRVVCFLTFVVAGSSASCQNVQLSNKQPCAYQTSDCVDGVVQWNYPMNKCEWTFGPAGASAIRLSATWATALGVNLTFFDGTSSVANQIGFVAGGQLNEASINVTSQTGVVFVKLSGPSEMLSYALIFDYTITTAASSKCTAYNGDCQNCLSAGCAFRGLAPECVDSCPTGETCLTVNRLSQITPASACASRLTDTCSSKSSCTDCQQAGCQWGTIDGADPTCVATCNTQNCATISICPGTCETKTTCESCLSSGCSSVGVDSNRLNCVVECPTDIPCFRGTPGKTPAQTCADRQASVEAAQRCDGANTDCTSCQAAGCKWNTFGTPGQPDACVTDCGFFRCEIALQCNSANAGSSARDFALMIVLGAAAVLL